ncbi:hypothetical protein P153DRAFT_432134 [Dothidotthia symphoricarpi CBS 119687]|uniref:Rhodopsin domain-containing protein n=1 Tax=Dothidotthia symphoricarpi CBS 119687 TaxID=1392245 RepID=A0A6A6AAA0_9PLEO|nr:uncharacterized protein P153DRAFT_432134 [Dothidotthia symphoricarpi CBS 119687]KAF2128496.1 hypothetical protein P153DRAFT_432134 [Dothidotthia symphoricarpi CBS 119687]
MANDYRSILNTVGWTLTTLSTLFTAARIYTRLKIATAALGWDDWCMLVAWVFATICTAIVTVGTTHGFGQHIWNIQDPEDQAQAVMYVMIGPLFSFVCAFLTKASIVIALLRIVGRTSIWAHRLIAWVSMILMFCASALACSCIIFFCRPMQKSWRPYVEGSCMSPTILDVAGRSVSAYNAFMDVLCAVVPYYLIRSLNIPRKDKRNLIILMGGSILGAFATIMKIVSMSTISNVTDMTHSWSELTIWQLTENHVLIIAGSIPALRPFWRTIVGKYTSFRSTGQSTPSGHLSNKPRGGDFHMLTVGSTPSRKSKSGLYSHTAKDESKENLTDRREEADTESVEPILSHYGRLQTHITRGNGTKIPDRSDTSITVTSVVEVV